MRRLGIILIAAAVLGVAGAAVIGNAGRAKVPELKMDKLVEAFNAAHKENRLLVTFSPT